MVKIFVGNIAENVSNEDLRALFTPHGKVTECDVLGNFGFVHMATDEEADQAIKSVDKQDLKGSSLNVEKSKGGSRGPRGGRGDGNFTRGSIRSGSMRGGFGGYRSGFLDGGDNSANAKSARRAGCTKLHIANLPEHCQSHDLRQLFERYGYVAECDVVEDRKIAFVHIEDAAADAAINGLNGYNYKGIPLKVQMSRNQTYSSNDGGRGGIRGGGRGSNMPPLHRSGRGGLLGRGGGRYNDFTSPGRGFGEFNSARGNGATDRSFGSIGDGGFEHSLPPPAKDRLELLDLLDRRRRLEALDPYERQLIACTDPYNLPPPTPEYLRLLRERALVKARLPIPASTGTSMLGRSLPTAGSTTTSSALTRAIIARRTAAVASTVSAARMRSSGGANNSYGEQKSTPSMTYSDIYASRLNDY